VTRPSTGIASPGFTITLSPTRTPVGLDLDLAPIAAHESARRPQVQERVQRAPGATHRVDLERVAEREQEHQHRGLRDVADRGRAARGEQHEQVDVEFEPGERRERAARGVPAAEHGRNEKQPAGDRARRLEPVGHGAGDEQRQAHTGEHGHGPALRALGLFAVREPRAPRLVRERAHDLDAVVGLLVAHERDAPARGAGQELGRAAGIEPAEPQRARLAGVDRLALLARGDPLREQRAHVVGERVQLVGRDERGPVAHGQRVVAEVRLDRDDARPLAQPVREDLEAALAVPGDRQVVGASERRGDGRAAAASAVVESPGGVHGTWRIVPPAAPVSAE
jgi:hypothetical protein